MADLLIRQDPSRAFLCVPGVIRRDDITEQIETAIQRFSQAAAGLGALGEQIALYHPQGRDPFGPDGEPFWLGRALTAPCDPPSGLQLNWTPGGEVAALAHEGPVEALLQTHFALHRSVSQRGRRLLGPNWEIYAAPGDDAARPPRVEVVYLLERRGAADGYRRGPRPIRTGVD